MFRHFLLTCVLAILYVRPSSGHASIFHPSMWGFNVTDHTYPYDNRAVAPLTDYTFQQWWFHGHLDHPPNPGDVFELPAGKPATTEIGCNKGATSYFASSEGGDIRSGDDPCPGSPPAEYHTNGPDDLKGCSLAIAYKNDVNQVQPEDFTVFSVNQTCVFHRFTDFQVPQRMPPCPDGGCICAWFWIHSQDSGGEQNYMTGFRCNITGSTSNVALAKPQVPRRCGADPENGKPDPAPGNCTYGAKQPFYWFQKERNNMFEGTYSPPFYLDLYNFKDGAQDDIFVDSYPGGIPPPSPNSTVVPTPFLGDISPLPATSVPSATSGLSTSSSFATPSSSISVNSSAISSQSSAISSTTPTNSGPSTVTVISVVTVTSTAAASTTSSTVPSKVQTTLFSTQIVTVTASVAANDIAPSVLVASVPSGAVTTEAPSTIFLNKPTATSISGLDAKKLAVERVESPLAPSVSASSNASSPTFGNSTRLQCKRTNPSLHKRSTALTSFSIPGFRHRRLTKRSRLWSIF